MPDNNDTKEFPKKYMKRLDETFVDNVQSMESDELKARILECESHLYDIEKFKEADEELVKAKEHAKELAKPHTENKNIETAKIKYCLYVLEGRGISFSRE